MARRVKGAEYLKFRCTGCGNCCRGTYVFITDADVQRLVDGTGQSPKDFVRFVNSDQANLEDDSALWVEFENGAVEAMTLRWVRGSKCMYLGPEEMCQAYEHRPVTCREHPFDVETTQAGKVKSLAVMGEERLGAFADVPTLNEATGSDWKMAAWRGVAGPKGMPDEATAKLSAALETVWKSAEFQEFMNGRGFGLVWKPGAEFTTWMKDSDEALGTVMTAVGLAK